MMHDARSSGNERSLGELLGDLTRELTTLVRQEMALAKTEMTHKAGRVGKDVGFLAAGGAILYAGFLALIAATIIGLAHLGLHWGWSAFLVGLAVTGVGGFLVKMGLDNLKREDLVPRQTIDSLKEDVNEPNTVRRAA
jgi:hypothetical protein